VTFAPSDGDGDILCESLNLDPWAQSLQLNLLEAEDCLESGQNVHSGLDCEMWETDACVSIPHLTEEFGKGKVLESILDQMETRPLIRKED